MAARHVIVAGAGIAGLTAALTLARAGMRVTVFEQAARLEETGAGLQLSPNASRVLIALGLRERLASVAVAPQAIRVMAGGSAREIVRIPLGDEMERRYGAPYWSFHRGDLQSALAEAVRKERDVVLELGARLEEFAVDMRGELLEPGAEFQHNVPFLSYGFGEGRLQVTAMERPIGRAVAAL